MVLGLTKDLDFPNVAPTHVKIMSVASYYHVAMLHGSSAQFMYGPSGSKFMVDADDFIWKFALICV